MAITATCHCGAITLTATQKPTWINDCQCTVCRRYGAAWAYYNTDDVIIKWKEGTSTRQYVWGVGETEFHFCERCGGMMYWWPAGKRSGTKEMGLNTRMVEPEVLKFVERRRTFVDLFDGEAPP